MKLICNNNLVYRPLPFPVKVTGALCSNMQPTVEWGLASKETDAKQHRRNGRCPEGLADRLTPGSSMGRDAPALCGRSGQAG